MFGRLLNSPVELRPVEFSEFKKLGKNWQKLVLMWVMRIPSRPTNSRCIGVKLVSIVAIRSRYKSISSTLVQSPWLLISDGRVDCQSGLRGILLKNTPMIDMSFASGNGISPNLQLNPRLPVKHEASTDSHHSTTQPRDRELCLDWYVA